MVFTEKQLSNVIFLKQQKIRLLKQDIISIQQDLQFLIHPVVRAQVKTLLYRKIDELIRELMMIGSVDNGTTIHENE